MTTVLIALSGGLVLGGVLGGGFVALYLSHLIKGWRK